MGASKISRREGPTVALCLGTYGDPRGWVFLMSEVPVYTLKPDLAGLGGVGVVSSHEIDRVQGAGCRV